MAGGSGSGSLSAIKTDVERTFASGLFWVLVRLDISGLPVNPDALIYYSSGAMAALHFRKAVEGAESRKRCVFGLFCLGAATVIYYIGLWQAHIPSFVLCRLCAVTGFWLVIPGKRLPEAKDFYET